jgi:hypothetical protein
MEQVKYGTYPATLTAADWGRILLALGAMYDEYKKHGLHGLAEDTVRTLENLRPQVMEDR